MIHSLAFEKVGQTLIIVHNDKAPTDQEWNTWIERMAKRDYINILVSSLGGGPTAAQRAKTNEFWKGKNVPLFSLITPSKIAIGLLTAFNWFLGDRLKAFSPENEEKAFDYIGIPQLDRKAVRDAILRMRAKLAR